ncbi:multidrug effflux MFS transporter [Paraconexibacter antarcticus]|uniref:Multidrug effflux MFS transporter n=1 Tax=Paraconexibacter antarcticus TaxID=2949664 RepID=A0ABY5DXX8_9ACTN|nr:multidrug effflux MFS transporter [Paraconexibacter antarcticus]UTI65490.1 multidrug effflux MFS transporter [Paraconexibacter antarcticus]
MSDGHPRHLLLLLGCLSTFGPLSMDMYLPGLPAMADDLGASTSAAQLTLTACLAGLATGQLLVGPLSDTHGRRRPLLLGLLAYAAASALCALAPSVLALTLLRYVQGVAGAAGIVIARAVVRDVAEGDAAARAFARLMLVSGLAPILAPVLGGQVLRLTDWRGVFGVLAVIGLALAAATARALPETHAPERRRTGGVRETTAVFADLLHERTFLACTLACGLSFAAMFAYIAGSPFVLQEVYGVSPQTFSALFALNAFGILLGSQTSGRLVGRVAPARLLTVGVRAAAAGAVGLLVVSIAHAGLAAVLVCLFLVVASIGLILPNAAAVGMAGHPRTAGSASALLGLSQYSFGALAAPLVGVAGLRHGVPMAVVIATAALGSLLALTVLLPRRVTAAAVRAAG